MAKKTLQEQTIRDSFLFAAAMMDGNGENSRAFLSCLLGKEIWRVEISYEKSIVYHPEQKGIRLDVYCADEANTRYNVEMQVISRKMVCQNKAKGRTVAEIAEFLNEDVDRIAAIYETCDAPTEDTKE